MNRPTFYRLVSGGAIGIAVQSMDLSTVRSLVVIFFLIVAAEFHQWSVDEQEDARARRARRAFRSRRSTP